METILVGYLILGVIFGFFCSYLADKKGHGGCAWFVLGFLFSFLALLVLIGLPREEVADPDPRLCPHCIQEVHELATACPHCQRDLPKMERCSYKPCGKVINPGDDRCEDDQGNPFCDERHRPVGRCAYAPCKKIIKPTDNWCEDDAGNLYCRKLHRWTKQKNLPDPRFIGIVVALGVAGVIGLAVLCGT